MGVGVVAYSPLGRGFLSATFASLDEMAIYDWRRSQPRFSDENFQKNLQTEFFEYAKKKNCSPAQLALAWLHHQGDDIFPIPGTKNPARVAENLGSLKIHLTTEEVEEVGKIAGQGHGDRYSSAMIKSTFDHRDNTAAV